MFQAVSHYSSVSHYFKWLRACKKGNGESGPHSQGIQYNITILSKFLVLQYQTLVFNNNHIVKDTLYLAWTCKLLKFHFQSHRKLNRRILHFLFFPHQKSRAWWVVLGQNSGCFLTSSLWIKILTPGADSESYSLLPEGGWKTLIISGFISEWEEIWRY